MQLQLASGMGTAVATFIDSVSGMPISLPVAGSLATCPSCLLQALAVGVVHSANILITDASLTGYLIEVTVDPATGTATLRSH